MGCSWRSDGLTVHPHSRQGSNLPGDGEKLLHMVSLQKKALEADEMLLNSCPLSEAVKGFRGVAQS